MDPGIDFTPLLVVSILAVAVPVFLHRIRFVRIPIIVGEIVAGIAVGPSGLGLIGAEANPWLDFLKLFGFVYLMFLSGVEIDFSILLRGSGGPAGGLRRRIVGGPLQAGLLSFAVTLGAAILFSRWLVEAAVASDVIIMALVLSTTSLGIVAPVLKERGLIREPFGQYTLVAATIGDFATVTFVSIYVILHTQGPTFELLFILILLAATFLTYRLLRMSQKHVPLASLIDELSHATAQLDTRGALALAVVFIALAQGLGVEMILGAFMAGAIVSLVSAEEGSTLRPKLHALGYGFFIPIFFVMVGADFRLPELMESPRGLLLVPILLLMAYAVKYLAALVYRPLFGWKDTFAIGTLTSARLSLIIAVATVGVEMGAIEQSTNAAIILVAIFSVIVSPILFNRVAPKPAPSPGTRVIIAGSTPHARLLAQRLGAHGDQVTLLTANRSLFQEMQDSGLRVLLAEKGRHAELLGEAGADRTDTLVSMIDDEDESLSLTRAAREGHGMETAFALVNNPNTARKFQAQGVRAVDPSASTLMVLEGLIHHPHAFSLIAETGVSQHVADIHLSNPRVEGRRLRKISLPGDALVLMIVRDGEVIIPRGVTRLRRGDLLTVVGSPESVEEAAADLGGA